jgi:hypothetical protein
MSARTSTRSRAGLGIVSASELNIRNRESRGPSVKVVRKPRAAPISLGSPKRVPEVVPFASNTPFYFATPQRVDDEEWASMNAEYESLAAGRRSMGHFVCGKKRSLSSGRLSLSPRKQIRVPALPDGVESNLHSQRIATLMELCG